MPASTNAAICSIAVRNGFRGNANDLLLVAARKADPDMLFFQRRLVIEGDTELGLEVKNVMDAIEPEAMPTALRTAIEQMAAFVDAGMKQDAKAAQARAGAACIGIAPKPDIRFGLLQYRQSAVLQRGYPLQIEIGNFNTQQATIQKV